MELQYFGGNCIKLTTKKASLVVDDNLADLGAKSVTRPGEVVLFTQVTENTPKDAKIVIAQPGEYEVSNFSITGVAARAHTDDETKHSATMYKIIADDLRIAVVGHVYPELSEDQLETLGTVDVLFIPVGGGGFTLDPVGALHVIKEIEPKLVIPTQYADNKLKYPVPALDLEAALKALSMEARETVPKLKLKAADLLSDQTQLIVLERQ